MFSIKRTVLTLLGVFIITGTAFAQGQQNQQQTINPDSVTDQELQTFADAFTEMRTVEQEAQKELMGILEEEGMKPQRFQKIMMSRQNPQMAQSITLTEDEKKIIQNIQPELQRLNKEVQQDQMNIIQDKEMTMQRFQNLAQAIGSDKKLNKRFTEIMSDTTGNGG